MALSKAAAERQTEFIRIFDALPGKQIEKIRKICELIFYTENYVRILLLKTDNVRVIPKTKLDMLKRELARDKDLRKIL